MTSLYGKYNESHPPMIPLAFSKPKVHMFLAKSRTNKIKRLLI